MKVIVYSDGIETLITTEDREQEMIKEWFEPHANTGRRLNSFVWTKAVWDSTDPKNSCARICVESNFHDGLTEVDFD